MATTSTSRHEDMSFTVMAGNGRGLGLGVTAFWQAKNCAAGSLAWAIQEKISRHENSHIFVTEEYFYIEFSCFILHIGFFHKSVIFCYIYSTFDEVMQRQSQCSIFANQQLNVSNFA